MIGWCLEKGAVELGGCWAGRRRKPSPPVFRKKPGQRKGGSLLSSSLPPSCPPGLSTGPRKRLCPGAWSCAGRPLRLRWASPPSCCPREKGLPHMLRPCRSCCSSLLAAARRGSWSASVRPGGSCSPRGPNWDGLESGGSPKFAHILRAFAVSPATFPGLVHPRHARLSNWEGKASWPGWRVKRSKFTRG